MSKQKTITEQIEELQEANKKLLEYENFFSKACQLNFGVSAKSIKESLSKSNESCSNFEKEIRKYYNLKSEQDIEDFLHIMCTETSLKYFEKSRTNND